MVPLKMLPAESRLYQAQIGLMSIEGTPTSTRNENQCSCEVHLQCLQLYAAAVTACMGEENLLVPNQK